MPFEPRFDLIYQEVFAPAVREAGLGPTRGDEIFGTSRVMQDVWNSIRSARVILAELTGRNANVLYELGLAHAVSKPVIIVTNTMDDVPFDLKDIRCIVYETHHPRWGENLRTRIVETIKSVVSSESAPLLTGVQISDSYPDAPENPISDPELIVEFDLAGTWDAVEVLTNSSPSPRWTRIQLTQDGGSLAGTARTIGPERENPSWIIEQSLIGLLREREVRLIATNFEIVERPRKETVDWVLDTWRGSVETPDLIVGEMAAGADQQGSFTMRRVE